MPVPYYPGDEGTLREPYDPVPVSEATLAFPGNVTWLIPPPEALDEAQPWFDPDWLLATDDFFFGRMVDPHLMPHGGVNPELAWRHLSVVRRSYQIKHQQKEAALTFLFHTWFEWATWQHDENGPRFWAGDVSDQDKDLILEKLRDTPN